MQQPRLNRRELWYRFTSWQTCMLRTEKTNWSNLWTIPDLGLETMPNRSALSTTDPANSAWIHRPLKLKREIKSSFSEVDHTSLSTQLSYTVDRRIWREGPNYSNCCLWLWWGRGSLYVDRSSSSIALVVGSWHRALNQFAFVNNLLGWGNLLGKD